MRRTDFIYTRMARCDLSIETLMIYNIDVEYCRVGLLRILASLIQSPKLTIVENPTDVIINRWMLEEDILWKHTRVIREKRSQVVLKIEVKDCFRGKRNVPSGFVYRLFLLAYLRKTARRQLR